MSTPVHRRRVMLSIAAIVIGIGSCQLPQPRPPKLPVSTIDGASALAALTTSAPARGGRS